ncbi:MAG: cupin domain-containing protein [Phycisphaeraceae bacterium]
MLIRRSQQVESQVMEMEGAEGVTMRLLVGREDGAPTFAMRLFEVSPGGHTPRHSHPFEHEAIILEGCGQVLGGVHGGTIRPVSQGDAIFIPAGEPHQFRNVGEAVLRFLCMVPVRFDCGRGRCEATPGS